MPARRGDVTVEECIRLYGEHGSTGKVADMLKCSTALVCDRLRAGGVTLSYSKDAAPRADLAIRSGRWVDLDNEDTKSEVIRMHIDMNMSPRRIAERLGCSRKTVSHRLKRWGVYTPRRSRTQAPLPKSKVVALYRGGATCQEIADTFGVSKSSVRDRLFHWNEAARPGVPRAPAGDPPESVPAGKHWCRYCGNVKPDRFFVRQTVCEVSGHCISCRRDRRFRKRYGISFAQAEALLRRQGGRCANPKCRARIFFSEPVRGSNRSTAAIDHCHVNGGFRSIMCDPCNSAAGMLSDSPSKAEGLAHVLRQTSLWEVGLAPVPGAMDAAE